MIGDERQYLRRCVTFQAADVGFQSDDLIFQFVYVLLIIDPALFRQALFSVDAIATLSTAERASWLNSIALCMVLEKCGVRLWKIYRASIPFSYVAYILRRQSRGSYSPDPIA
jgi:hypothetical protein